MLSSHTYYTPYNYALSRSLHQNFMLHLYIIDNMFLLHLLSYSIIHLISNYLDLLPLSSLSHSRSLAASFTNSMLLLLLNLYISMSLFVSSPSSYLYLLMLLLGFMYLYNLLWSLLPPLMLLLLDSLSSLLAHFRSSLSIHSIRIHSLLYMSHLSLLMNYIYNFMLITLSLLHFILLMLMLSYSFQTMHYSYYYLLLILVLSLSLVSLSHLVLLMFII